MNIAKLSVIAVIVVFLSVQQRASARMFFNPPRYALNKDCLDGSTTKSSNDFKLPEALGPRPMAKQTFQRQPRMSSIQEYLCSRIVIKNIKDVMWYKKVCGFGRT